MITSHKPPSAPRPASATPGVMVVGMGRSGTSMVARLLCAAGLDLGPASALYPADKYNPSGYFEHSPLTALNDRILDALGGDFHHPPQLAGADARLSALAPFSREAAELLAGLSAKGPWACKDPRLTVLLPFWKPLLPGARYVICLRHPWAVAGSIAALAPFAPEHALELWSRYLFAALQDTQGEPRHVAIYERFFSHTDAEIQALLSFSGLPASALGAAQGAIEPGLFHHHSDPWTALDDLRLPKSVRDLYARVLSLRY
jgi:hypothetical protein